MISSSFSTITALLIDPVLAKAQCVPLALQDGELVLDELYRLIRCDLVERAPLDDHHQIWTDENGWDQATGITVIDDGANVIAGRFLIIGATPDDEPRDVVSDPAPLLARFTCHRCIFEPEFSTLSGDTAQGFFIQQRLIAARPRIEKIKPSLVARRDLAGC
jgi:hypothetical protein